MELLTKDELSRLTLVEFDLEDPESISPAIGKAATVVCCVGAPESQILDVQAPYRIDGQGTISLIEEGERMGSVSLFVLVTSLGTGRAILVDVDVLGWRYGFFFSLSLFFLAENRVAPSAAAAVSEPEKFGWPAGVLNLFWGVLIWKRKAEQALESSRFPSWVIVRPGGMERPTDSYSENNATRLFQKNTQFGGQVAPSLEYATH